MIFPETLNILLTPLFEALPLERAMPELCPRRGANTALLSLVETAVHQAPLRANPALQAGLWLYVDELDRSHTISQELKNATGSYWHGIMHRREGDFSNSHYWFHKTGKHPAMLHLPDYDGHGLVVAAEAAYPGNPSDVVARQRAEWANLFTWCASSR
ncbi:MAG: hypothetical protein JNK74_27850 [Candidatus Hydrogenedentes bacterium]|nr:hypothetical protein [Candidatus Hydrogenedentota bacterium]